MGLSLLTCIMGMGLLNLGKVAAPERGSLSSPPEREVWVGQAPRAVNTAGSVLVRPAPRQVGQRFSEKIPTVNI